MALVPEHLGTMAWMRTPRRGSTGQRASPSSARSGREQCGACSRSPSTEIQPATSSAPVVMKPVTAASTARRPPLPGGPADDRLHQRAQLPRPGRDRGQPRQVGQGSDPPADGVPGASVSPACSTSLGDTRDRVSGRGRRCGVVDAHGTEPSAPLGRGSADADAPWCHHLTRLWEPAFRSIRHDRNPYHHGGRGAAPVPLAAPNAMRSVHIPSSWSSTVSEAPPPNSRTSTRMTHAGPRKGFIVVTPQGPGATWQLSGRGSDARYDATRSWHAWRTRRVLDLRHVHAMGFSQGAAFTILYACAHPPSVRGDLHRRRRVRARLHGSALHHGVPRHGGPRRPVPERGDRLVPPRGQDARTILNMGDWAHLDGCGPGPRTVWLATDVKRSTWPGAAGNEVALYTVVGGGTPGRVRTARIRSCTQRRR